jgi:hypothetical protein
MTAVTCYKNLVNSLKQFESRESKVDHKVLQGHQFWCLSPISLTLSRQRMNPMSWIHGRCIVGLDVCFPACAGTHLPTRLTKHVDHIISNNNVLKLVLKLQGIIMHQWLICNYLSMSSLRRATNDSNSSFSSVDV